MDLRKLLKPRSVAIVGASEKDGFGGDTIRIMLTYAKDLSRTYFVNPGRDIVFGRRCYHSLEDIPDIIDLVIICTPQKTVNDILRQAAGKGCGGAVIFASGYGETGPAGKAAEEELVGLSRELNIAFMGPNCAGFANYIDGVFSFAFLTEERERKGNIGLVAQSGQVCLSALDSPAMKFSYIISSGNNSGVRAEDYLDFLVDDDDTKVIALYLEGVKDTKTLVLALEKAAKKRKPVVVLKTGRSPKGSQLAASHTGSLSGSDKAFDALVRKFGVIRVNDFQELLGTATMFSVFNELPKITKYASANVSGGETCCMADLGYLYDVEFADLEDKTLARLREIMPSYATPSNPLDMTATLAYDAEKFAAGLEAMMRDVSVGAVIIGYTLLPEIFDTTILHLIRGAELVAGKPWAKPLILVPFVEHSRNRECLGKLSALGVPVLPSGIYAFRLLKYLSDFVNYDYCKHTLDLAAPAEARPAVSEALSEHESKLLLAEYGVKIDEEYVAATAEEALLHAEQLGYPLVMKVESPDILHKSDVGGVKVNIRNPQEVQTAFAAIMDNARSACPTARINGILMMRMRPRGVEVIVGIDNDPQLGPMIMVGLGGIFVEIFQDVALYPAPISRDEALVLIKSLKGYKLLAGYRGEKRCDIDALAEAIVGIAQFAYENKDNLKELDINPIFVYPEGEGIAVIDALIVKYQD